MIHICSSEAKAFIVFIVACIVRYTLSGYFTLWYSLGFACFSCTVCRLVARGTPASLPLRSSALAAAPVAVVTGASSGVGYEIAVALLLAGWRVVITGRQLQTLLEARKKMLSIQAAHRAKDPRNQVRGDVYVIATMDLTDEDSISTFTQKLLEVEASLPISLLVNAAGVLRTGLYYCNSASRWWDVEEMVATNAVGPMLLSLQLLPILKRTSIAAGEPSKIVNVASSCHSFLGVFNPPNPIAMLSSLVNSRGARLSRPSESSANLMVKGEDSLGLIDESQRSYVDCVANYGLSKLCGIWNTAILTDLLSTRRGDGEVIVVSTHPGICCTHLYRDLFPNWMLDRALYYPSLVVGKTVREAAFSTLRAINESPRRGGAGYYLCSGEPSRCLSSNATSQECIHTYRMWLGSVLHSSMLTDME